MKYPNLSLSGSLLCLLVPTLPSRAGSTETIPPSASPAAGTTTTPWWNAWIGLPEASATLGDRLKGETKR